MSTVASSAAGPPYGPRRCGARGLDEVLDRAAAAAVDAASVEDLPRVIARTAAARDLQVHINAPLLGGGELGLLLCPGGGVQPEALSPTPGVAVVVAGRGASDALRARLRALAAHSEVAAIVVVTDRPRHQRVGGVLIDDVPVRVVVLSTGT